MKNKITQVALIILDGWGYREDTLDNAVSAAQTPNFDRLWATFPHTLLEASGLAVGLPDGQMGNSEIGHTTIGAGRALDTDLVRIRKAIDQNEFVTNNAFMQLFDHVKKFNSTLHIKGLVGYGGVHSHQDHLIAFLRAAKSAGVEKIAIHAFTDGRDTAPQSSREYLEEIENVLSEIGIGFIATVSGRFYAMDRDNNWDRVARAEAAMFESIGNEQSRKPSEFIAELHKSGIQDEHIEPIVFLDADGQSYKVNDNDAILFSNFRSDRARMLSKRIQELRKNRNICYATLTQYDNNDDKKSDVHIAFPKLAIETTLAKEVSEAGLSQAHIAETEKFPHATYFLNGGVEKPYDNEKHIMLDSRKDVPTHDLAPLMRAASIADEAIREIQSGTNFIFINFANPDMVGHTANVPAIIVALEEVDQQLGRVVEAMETAHGIVFVTADHGNAEVNRNPVTGERHTAHTTNLVPAIVTSKEINLRDTGSLTDIAPTILEILAIEKPAFMTGFSLIR